MLPRISFRPPLTDVTYGARCAALGQARPGLLGVTGGRLCARLTLTAANGSQGGGLRAGSGAS